MKFINNQKGMILAMTMGFMLVFTMFGLSTIYLSGMQNQAQEKQIFNTQAFWLAEAGVQRCLIDLKNNPTYNTDSRSYSEFIGTTGDYETTVSGLQTSINPAIISTGYTPTKTFLHPYKSTIRVDLIITNGNVFKYAAFGKTSLSFGLGNSVGNGRLYGDLGTYDDEINNVERISPFEGTPYYNLTPLTTPLLPVSRPDTKNWSVKTISTFPPKISGGNYIYSSTDPLNPINLDGEITIDGTVNICIKSNVVIINNATIILKSGSSVVFYLDYPIEDFPSGGYFGNGSGNNFTITQEGTAPQSRNFMILEVSNCSTIAFKNSGTFYGVIYAPSTTIDINNVNSGILYGSFVGETVHFGNNFDLHHDPTLGSNTNPCIIKEWQEVP